MNTRLFGWILLTALSVTMLANAQDMTAREIIKKGQDAVQLSGSEAVMTLTIIDDKGRERVRKIAQVTKVYENGDVEKRLVRFLEPADVKGTGLLTVDYENKDDDMWLYMPALRKTRRIVSTEKAKNFMGSEFTYADMTPPNLDDFTYNPLADAEVDGESCYVIEMIPVNDEVADEQGFSKRTVYSSKNDLVLRKAEYYDFYGDLLKVLTIEDVKLLDADKEKYRPMLLRMDNVQNGRASVMKVEQIQINPNIQDEYFTTRYLERE